MTTYIALLRAVNVSGQNRVPMAELRASLAGLGLRNVRTYLQSGNAVFRTEAAAAAVLATAIEQRIADDLGVRAGVLVVPAADFAGAVDANPFAGGAGTEERLLYATFLMAPGAGVRAERTFGALALPAAEGEAAAFVGSPTLVVPIVFLRLPHGYGRTKLSNLYFERALASPATTRNWRTVRALAEMSAGGA